MNDKLKALMKVMGAILTVIFAMIEILGDMLSI
jgi:hypothetical protein